MSDTRTRKYNQISLEQLLKQVESSGANGPSVDIFKTLDAVRKIERGLIQAKGKAEWREKKEAERRQEEEERIRQEEELRQKEEEERIRKENSFWNKAIKGIKKFGKQIVEEE